MNSLFYYTPYALDYCDQTDGLPDDAKFRWTCESSWVTREYLRSRPASQIERFKKRIAEGRIEVTAMYANMAEIADENIMYDFLQPLKEFNKLGIPVKTAMQNDVNGLVAEVKLSSAVPGKSIRKMIEVNAIGKQIGQPVTSILLKPYEVRFIEVEF